VDTLEIEHTDLINETAGLEETIMNLRQDLIIRAGRELKFNSATIDP
jgi:hypothetical protein